MRHDRDRQLFSETNPKELMANIIKKLFVNLIKKLKRMSLISKEAALKDFLDDVDYLRGIRINPPLKELEEIIGTIEVVGDDIDTFKIGLNGTKNIFKSDLKGLVNDILKGTLNVELQSESDEFNRGRQFMMGKYFNYYDSDDFDFNFNTENPTDDFLKGIIYTHHIHREYIPLGLSFKIEESIIKWKKQAAYINETLSKTNSLACEEWFWDDINDQKFDFKKIESFIDAIKNNFDVRPSLIHYYKNHETCKNIETIIKFESILTDPKTRLLIDDWKDLMMKWNKKTFDLVKEANNDSLQELSIQVSEINHKDRSLLIKNILLEIVLRISKIINRKSNDPIKIKDDLDEIKKLSEMI